MSVELKPCPFCGSKDVSVLYNNESNALYIGADGSVRHIPFTHIIKCQCCETQTGEYEDVMMAIAAWNRRAET